VRHLHDGPLVFTGAMWREWVDSARRTMLRPGSELPSQEDMTIPRCVDTADEAIANVQAHHEQCQARRSPR